jgi:hypothetical protein
MVALKGLANVAQVCLGFTFVGFFAEGFLHTYFSPAPMIEAPSVPVWGLALGAICGLCLGIVARHSATATSKLVGLVVGALVACVPALVPLAAFASYQIYQSMTLGVPYAPPSWRFRIAAGLIAIPILVVGAVIGFALGKRFVEPWSSASSLRQQS